MVIQIVMRQFGSDASARGSLPLGHLVCGDSIRGSSTCEHAALGDLVVFGDSAHDQSTVAVW